LTTRALQLNGGALDGAAGDHRRLVRRQPRSRGGAWRREVATLAEPQRTSLSAGGALRE